MFALPLGSRAQISDPGVQQALRAYGRDVTVEPAESETVSLRLAL